MTRVIALNLLLIFLPFLLYAAYVVIEKKPEDKDQFWGFIPLKPLFIIGFVLMAIFYISQIHMVPETKDGIYHPATVKDGKVIPGYIEPFDKSSSEKPEEANKDKETKIENGSDKDSKQKSGSPEAGKQTDKPAKKAEPPKSDKEQPDEKTDKTEPTVKQI